MKLIDTITGEILENVNLNDYVALKVYEGNVEVVKRGEEYLHYAFEYRIEVGEISYDNFLKNCIACGGNWSNMLITGIKSLYPRVYDLMPDREYSFLELVELIEMCGVKIEK